MESQGESPEEHSGDGTNPRTALRREENPNMESPEGPGGGNGQESQGGTDTPKQPLESLEDIATPKESSPLDSVTTDDQRVEGSSDWFSVRRDEGGGPDVNPAPRAGP